MFNLEISDEKLYEEMVELNQLRRVLKWLNQKELAKVEKARWCKGVRENKILYEALTEDISRIKQIMDQR